MGKILSRSLEIMHVEKIRSTSLVYICSEKEKSMSHCIHRFLTLSAR